jgi:hypothetical protein
MPSISESPTRIVCYGVKPTPPPTQSPSYSPTVSQQPSTSPYPTYYGAKAGKGSKSSSEGSKGYSSKSGKGCSVSSGKSSKGLNVSTYSSKFVLSSYQYYPSCHGNLPLVAASQRQGLEWVWLWCVRLLHAVPNVHVIFNVIILLRR